MKTEKQSNIESLIVAIRETSTFFQNQAQKQVNVALTLRNWVIGYYLFEYEQNGSDRAEYGEQLYKKLSDRLIKSGIKGLFFTTLYKCKVFYLAYPHIVQTVYHKFKLEKFTTQIVATLSLQFPLENSTNQILETPSLKFPLENTVNQIIQTPSEQFPLENSANQILETPSLKFLLENSANQILETPSLKFPLENTVNQTVQASSEEFRTDPEILVNRLSFSHFIELLKADTKIKRTFYEVEALTNNWSVRDLQRAMNSMLYERTGLSKDKKAVIQKHKKDKELQPADIFRNPYILEFLGLEEKAEYTESDLEQAITSHLQSFLIELGRGFCFEARQKRITFDNKHYRIDLVFYHRILKCHILIDLKIGEFDHADAGQMNVYLNYYKENEVAENDNPPIGIILCAGKNENLVKYATAGLPQPVFVSKYMVNLPSEAELGKIIELEQQKLNSK